MVRLMSFPVSSNARSRAARSLLSVVCLMAAACPALCEDEKGPLRIRVNPSGFEGAHETIDEKLARRTRELEFRFRLICRGCLNSAAEARLEHLPDPNARTVPVD